jgi:hypothetical protein
MLHRCVLALFSSTLLCLAQEDGAAFFEKNIRPVLVAKCLNCHSATSQPIMGGLRLDTREQMLKGGSRGTSIVVGKPEESLLMKVMMHTAGPLKMPPGPKMKDAETALFAQWIAMGAPWGNNPVVSSSAKPKKHWSLIPPTEPSIPKVANAAWVKSPIDAFIASALEAKGLKPSAPASRRTLIRRATYDLTGLPPTTEEVEAFLNDSSPEAYAKVIDRLLASPRYGERWGRHWLDVARYADSNGLDENLVYKNAFRYRDYVIAAFNADKPYDQFVTEQLAGDLLPPTDNLKQQFERWTATGFLSLGAKMLAEDDPMKMQMDIIDEQVDTMAKAFMGLTVGCARCHDHKFDPIPTADYYALAGIFKSTKTMDHFKVVAKWHEHVLAPKEDRDRLAAHEALIEAKRKEISTLTKAENNKLAEVAMRRVGAYLLAARDYERDAKIQVAPVEEEKGATVRTAVSFDSGNIPKTLEKGKANTPKDSKGPYFAEYQIEASAKGLYQLDVLNQEKGSGTADLWVNGVWMKQGAGPVQNRAASPEAPGWSYLAIVPLEKGINRIRLEHASRFPYFEKLLVARHTGKETPKTTVQIANQYGVNPSFLDQLIEFFDRSQAASSSVLYAWEIQGRGLPLSAWSSPAASLFQGEFPKSAEGVAQRYEVLFQQALDAGKDVKDPGLKALYDFLKEKFGPFSGPENARRYYSKEVRAQLEVLEADAKKLEAATPEFPKSMGVLDSDKAEDIPIHIRGSHWTLGEKVPRGFLRTIETKKIPTLEPNQSGRLQLAEWLTQKDHPLTSRVMANRIWRGHFGRGIVASVDNFGRLGDKPSHPELLDWLALRFSEQGWSIKQLHRTILLSNTYQMSSDHDAKGAEVDPENVLLWRMPRRRLEAEAIRDAVMSASGGLDFSMGGSLLTYKDRQYVANTAKGSTVDYDRKIRAIYVPVLRSSMYEVFSAFDLPDSTMSNGDRDSTVVAPQALFMMNSSVILNHSRIMAESLKGDPSERVKTAYQRALSRPATATEIDQALSFISKMQKEWKGDELKAWQSFCKSLLASSEFIYLN